MRKNNAQKPKTVVDKVRKFRDNFYANYMKRHQKFDIHQFTAEFLNKAYPKKA